MTELAIDPTRLKSIRTARKIGRPKLAKLAGLSERQVARIETGQALDLDAVKATRLADVLGVPVPTLTGALDLAESDLQPLASGASKCGCCP